MPRKLLLPYNYWSRRNCSAICELFHNISHFFLKYRDTCLIETSMKSLSKQAEQAKCNGLVGSTIAITIVNDLNSISSICEKINLFSSHIFIIPSYNNYTLYFLIKTIEYFCEKINKKVGTFYNPQHIIGGDYFLLKKSCIFQ